MNHRLFGRTGINVSEVIFGGGNVGGILIHPDEATKREAVRRAIAGGINWFDTAAMYGNGQSEEALGRLLPESGAESVPVDQVSARCHPSARYSRAD